MGRRFLRDPRRDRIEGLRARHVGDMDPRAAGHLPKGLDRGHLRLLGPGHVMTLEASPRGPGEAAGVLCVDDDETVSVPRSLEDVLHRLLVDLEVARGLRHVDLEADRVGHPGDRAPGARGRVEGVVNGGPSPEGGRLLLERDSGRHGRDRVGHVRDGRHAAEGRGPRPAREVLLAGQPGIPEVDVGVHAAREDQGVAEIGRLLAPKHLLHRDDLAVRDPDGRGLEASLEEHAPLNDEHPSHPGSGGRRPPAARPPRRSPPGTFSPGWIHRATRPPGGPP